MSNLFSSPSFENKIRELTRQQGQIVLGGSWDDKTAYDALGILVNTTYKDPDHSYYLNIIQPLFKNTLGHCVPGPAVKTITYPTHCCNYDVHDKLPNETSKEHLHQFFAKALKAEIELLLREPPELEESTKRNPLQASDIAIIKDIHDGDLDLDINSYSIKTLLCNAQVKTCTVTEQQGGTNEVAICYSCDIASLEWPMVFHVSTKERSYIKKITENCLIYPSVHGESIIISRAKVQYILLCVNEDHYYEIFPKNRH